MNIGIVGAGAAGLSAAYDFTKAGHNVNVFESAPFIGGQASTIEVEGGRIERGYHHLFTNDSDIIELMDEMGIKDDLQWFPSTVGIYTGDRVYNFITPLDLMRFSPLPVLDRIRLGLITLRLRRHKDWRSLETYTANDWILEHAGPRVHGVVWGPLLTGKFGEAASKVGMPWFWSKIQTRFASRRGFGREVLGYLPKSFDVVFDTLRSEIETAGGKVLLETPVERVLVKNGMAQGLRFRLPNGTVEERNFDLILATVPSFTFIKLVELPEEYRSMLTGVEYLAASVIILEMDRPLTSVYWMNIADDEIPFLGIIEHTNLIPSENYNGNHLLYLTNYFDRRNPLFNWTGEKLLEHYLPYLHRFNHDFERSWIKRFHYNKVSAAQPIIGTNYSSNLPDHRTPVRQLYLANTTQIYPEDRGTNYSVRMGRQVASMMMTDAAAGI